MDLTNLTPFQSASLLWRPAHGFWAATIVCKATYILTPKVCRLAEVQEPLYDDNHWDDDLSRSLRTASDMVPHKPRADVVLVGHAFAPRQIPVPSLFARLSVGTVDKSIRVFCDRWWTPTGAVRAGPKIVRASLRYERAAAGTENPVGVPLDAPPDKRGLVPIPTLLPFDHVISGREDPIPSVGFGPIAPTWPSRSVLLGNSARWSPEEVLSDAFNFSYFNVAPTDQQIDQLNEDTSLLLENLHSEHALLTTRLPGDRPRVAVEFRASTPQELEMRCDTLWIDTDRGLCTLSWRGSIDLENVGDVTRAVVALARDIPHKDEDESAEEVIQIGDTVFVDLPPEASLYDRELDDKASRSNVALTAVLPDGVALDLPPMTAPKVSAEPDAAIGPPRKRPPVVELVDTMVLTDAPKLLAATPFTRAPSSSPFVPPPPALVPLVREPAYATPPLQAPPPLSSEGISYAPNGPLPDLEQLSNIAAGVRPATLSSRAEEPREPLAKKIQVSMPKQEAVELLWFDDAFLDRIRAVDEWKVLLAERALRELDQQLERKLTSRGGGQSEQTSTDEDSHLDLLEVLSRGTPLSPDRVKDELEIANARGAREPPLVLVNGELEFMFDELDSLKAAVAAVEPLLPAAEKDLKEAVDAGMAILKSSWPNAVRSRADGATEQIKTAFKKIRRQLPSSYVDDIVERTVVQGRCYQRRTVLGQTWLRAFLRVNKTSEKLLVYLPESLDKKFPLFPSIKARIIAEVRPKQDMYEVQLVALKPICVARVES